MAFLLFQKLNTASLSKTVSLSLVYLPQAQFSNRFRVKRKYNWQDYGSLEQEINEKLPVEQKHSLGYNSKRCGALGYKIGMTTIFDKWGAQIPWSVIQLDRCQVLKVTKNQQGSGKNLIEVGAGEAHPDHVTKSMLGHFVKAGVPAKRHCASFEVTEDNFLPVGYMIGPSHFKIGNFVDIKGTSKGKGFQGVIKRWNFSHQYYTHGNSLSHRAPGALQGAEEPGKVFKGKKMAGHLGNEGWTQFSSKVVKIDTPRSLLYVRGSIPGSIGGMVKIRDAFKKMSKQKAEPNDIRSGVDTWQGEDEDPFEKYDHDNAGVAGPDNEDD